ncbi:hypothetical protein FRB97_008349, partial [Tulasnella sp. 331]
AAILGASLAFRGGSGKKVNCFWNLISQGSSGGCLAFHQLAHHVASNNDAQRQWGGLLWYLVWAHLEGNPQITRLRDLENVLSPRLSDTVNGEWEQFPQVSMSYHDPHAVFQNWF